MSERVNKFIVTGTTNLTDIMSGTSANFQFEVIEVYLNGSTAGFTWSNGVLNVPSYTSQTIYVDFNLYLISGSLSKYLPKDPTNPASDLVLWEDRILQFPNVSTQMRKIEDGIVESDIGAIQFLYRGGWDELARYETFFVNKPIAIYRDDTALFFGKADGSGTNSGVYTVTISNVDLNLDKECNFGDPEYLNRIDITSSNAFYTGSNIADQFDGWVIPMCFGPRTPYEDRDANTISNGNIVNAVPPLVLPPVNTPTRQLGSSFILRVIPLSSTQGILCRTPTYQTLQSQTVTENIPFSAVRTFSKTTFDSSATLGIHGQLVKFNQGSDGGGSTLAVQSGRIIEIKQSSVSFELNQEDVATANYASYVYDTKAHLCSNKPAQSGFPGTVTLTNQGTPGGNKLWKLTTSNIDLNDGEYFFVCSDVAGSRSAPKVSEFILDSHGFTTDSSFDTVGASLPTPATMQIGNGTNMPTINEALSEINRSLLTMIKKPLDSDVYSIHEIDINPSPTITLTENEIANVTTTETQNATYGVVEFEPKYLKGSMIRDTVYAYKTNSSFKNVLGIEKTKVIAHCLNSIPSRWDDVTAFWSKPDKTVGFVLMDESYSINVGDYIYIDHDNFTGTILITRLSPKSLGVAITGRKI